MVYLDSSLVFFFKSTNRPVALILKGAITTPKDTDYFQFSFIDKYGVQEMGRIFGKTNIEKKINIKAIGDFQISLKFVSASDGALTEGGVVTLDSITIYPE